ncbi:uncharacterized protein LOC131997715 [Stomoxys calcitrans]|uniref:uncharacterized protein LOC131994866 n=1 Tax=Stomoxys calcitrans TaxID=35570 RepID=UPI0027E278CF|nr:uncharacterized protein LOC131994866 [Stomoxys calcitrans]XP_059218834.1 uncharacterized protein LOC131995074 [Stomoxys calcitrans]XP_059219090.1 uncharacterized protein LOC131995116 isoform X2 [Stomoxys calcitrans]XP_059222255.1 uncharacterized protein LOC131996649 [Stomoxys calcitrans]XP_059222838.1 uncharacterized protein LOC131996826 [Stomoxys calcitrans]XP_059225083.1 uncharacterized protein LOC131997715 [Stomoxys calcitrans]
MPTPTSGGVVLYNPDWEPSSPRRQIGDTCSSAQSPHRQETRIKKIQSDTITTDSKTKSTLDPQLQHHNNHKCGTQHTTPTNSNIANPPPVKYNVYLLQSTILII